MFFYQNRWDVATTKLENTEAWHWRYCKNTSRSADGWIVLCEVQTLVKGHSRIPFYLCSWASCLFIRNLFTSHIRMSVAGGGVSDSFNRERNCEALDQAGEGLARKRCRGFRLLLMYKEYGRHMVYVRQIIAMSWVEYRVYDIIRPLNWFISWFNWEFKLSRLVSCLVVI